MSDTCTQQFTISPSYLKAYWTFDEVYGANYNPATWTDMVQSIQITGFENDSNANGLYGRSRDAINWGALYWPELPYVAANPGFSVFFWIRKSLGAGGSTDRILFDFNDSTLPVAYAHLLFEFKPAGPNEMTVRLTTNPGFGFDDLQTITCTPAWMADWAAGNWCFCCATYTTADKKLRFYDGVSPAVVSAGTVDMYDFQTMRWGALVTAGTGLFSVDEAGISVTTPLTATQTTWLYNSGAGQTWPTVKDATLN